MTALAAISTLAFVLASAVVGARILWRAWQTRGLPELLLGLALFGSGGVAFPLSQVLASGRFPGAELWLQAIAMAALATSGISSLAFTRVVFRPESRLGSLAFAAGALGWLGFVATGYWALLQTQTPLPPTGTRVIVRHALMLAGYSWAAIEAVQYFRRLGRQLRVGLGDPVVTNRILLWSIAAAAAASINLVLTGVAVNGGDPLTSNFVRLVIAAGGSTAACSLWLAFLPPRGYLDAVQARAAA